MKRHVPLTAVALLIALGACEGRSDENIGAAIENEAPEIANNIENVAEDVGNEAERAADAVAGEARDVANEIDDGERNRNAAAGGADRQ